jgi:chromosome segregation and condensation protein ScpB
VLLSRSDTPLCASRRPESRRQGNALETLLTRQLVALNQAQLFVTTRSFLDFAGLRDLADLPPLEDAEGEVSVQI